MRIRARYRAAWRIAGDAALILITLAAFWSLAVTLTNL